MSALRVPHITRNSALIAMSLAATLAIGAGAWLTLERDSFAQDGGDRSVKPQRKATKPGEKNEAAPAAPPVAPAVPSAAQKALSSAAGPSPVAAPADPDVAVQLKQAGAGACAPQVNALAAASMAGVAQFNTVSNWSTAGGNGRPVSVAIGQRYPEGAPVPYGATSVMAAPNGQGSCDAMAVQVVPSPLPCAKLRETIAARGKQLGDLAGVPLMQDGGGQTLLVPTAADTCVLVGLRAAYAR